MKNDVENIIVVLNCIVGILLGLWSFYKEVSGVLSAGNAGAIGQIVMTGSSLEVVHKGDVTGIEYIKQYFTEFAIAVIFYAIVTVIIVYVLARVLIMIEVLIAGAVIRLILGKTVNEKMIKEVTAERDSTRQSIDEKTNEITIIQAELNSSEHQLERIEKEKESIINKLSQVSPQEMEKEFVRLV